MPVGWHRRALTGLAYSLLFHHGEEPLTAGLVGFGNELVLRFEVSVKVPRVSPAAAIMSLMQTAANPC
jgi:hypothetical protein